MLYVISDSPESGYFDESDVRPGRHGPVVVDSDGEWIGYAEPAVCGVCSGPIPEDASYALCALHEGSSRSGGRASLWQERYERDVGGRGR